MIAEGGNAAVFKLVFYGKINKTFERQLNVLPAPK
jgi:hypothetical protein